MALPNYASKSERMAYARLLGILWTGAVLSHCAYSDNHPLVV